MIYIKTWLKLLSFAALAALLVLALRTELFRLILQGDLDGIRTMAQGNMLELMLLTLVLMVLQNSFTVLPLVLLVTFNISVFGFFNGYLWSWSTSIVGAIVPFLITRFWFQDMFVAKIKEEWRRKLELNGFWFVFAGRVFPFMPTSVINLASGVSSVTIKHYMWSTVLGNMIYVFALALIPLGIMSVKWEPRFYVPVALAALAAVIAGVAWRRRSRRKAAEKQLETGT